MDIVRSLAAAAVVIFLFFVIKELVVPKEEK